MNFIYLLNENEIGTNPHPGGYFAAFQGPGDPWFLYLIPVFDDGDGYMIDDTADPIQTSIRSDNSGYLGPIMDGSKVFAEGSWTGEIDLGGYMLPTEGTGDSGSGGGDLGLPVYSLTIDAIGAHEAGLYAIDQDEQGNILLVTVEEDTETAATDDYIVVDTVDPIMITGLDDATKAALLEGSWDGGATGSTLVGQAFYVDVPGGEGSITELMIDDFGTPEDPSDDELVIARAADDTEDYSAADLILRISLDGGSNYGDYSIAMDVFATADGVGMVDTSISGGTYSISSQMTNIMTGEGYDPANSDHSASLVLVDDFNAGAGNYTDLMELPLNQAAPEDPNVSEAITHLRFDNPENPTKILLDISPDDSTIDPTTADLMVEYTFDNWTTVERSLIQGNAFAADAGAIINGNVIEREAPDVSNILTGAGFDENNSDHHFGIVLVDDWTAQIPIYVAEFLVPSEGDGADDGTGGGDGNTPPEFTVLTFNDKGTEDPSDDTFMIVRGENDDDDYSGADLMAWIRPEGADPHLLEIMVDPFPMGSNDEIMASALEAAVATAFGGEANVPDFVELVLVDDSSAVEPFVLAELMGINEGGDTSSPTGEYYDVYDLDVDDFGLTEAGTYALLFEGPNEIGKFNLLLQEVALDTSTSTYHPVGTPEYAASGTSSIYPVGPVNNPDGFYQIHSLAAGQFGATHAGFYVIWPGVEGNGVHMFEVENTGTAESPTWANIANATPPTPVGSVFIGDPVDDGTGGGGPDTGGEESPFELVEVADARYGDIITFGIRVKDNEDGTTDSIDLASGSFQIDWEDGEYEYWGGFENVAPTPDNSLDPETGSADLNTLGLTLTNAGEEATRINLETFMGSTPVTYSEGDLVATFMLERTDQSEAVENFIDLTKSNYTTADAPLDDILTAPQTFRYDYDQDTINIDMITASGEEAPDATLYVSSDTVTDGLSLVAVEQMGRLVKYQLVLNVSVPMTMDELAMIDTSQSVDIYGAHIFTDSLIDITSFEAGGDGEGAVSAAVITATDGDDASVTVGDAAGGYSGTEFFDQVDAAMSLLEDSDDASLLEAIDVTDHLHIDVTALGDLQGDGLDGRYVLAEFVAFTDGSISFSDDWNMDDGITISQIAVNGADVNTQTFDVSDGSDVVLLGESVYLNPGLNIDAISATDALGALKIATDDTGYSQSQIIAADFDADGVVEAMDAYNILHYAVFGEGSGDEVPTWVYIDDIDSGTATAEAVTYDNNIDLFIGDLTDIDATGVLRGDVSENYTEIPDGYNTLDYYLGAFTEAMGDLGTDLETVPSYVA